MDSKVATVEDFDSVIQDTLPASRREAFRKRASGLASVTNSSDTGTVDSGYSSNSTANAAGEFVPESPTRPVAHSDVSTSEKEPAPSRPPLVTQPSSSQDGRKSRAGNPHRISGSYSYTSATLQHRPVSRAASKSMRDGRASPAIRCPPINTTAGGDECDCKDCNAAASNEPRPSSMLSSTSAGLESPWPLELKNGLPYIPPGNSWSSTPLSSSPGNNARGGSKNGFPFDTFSTPSLAATPNGLGSTRPQSFMSSSNPLAAWNSYEYTASPSAYTPVSSLHSPPPYLGSGASSSWVPPMSGLGGPELLDDYGYSQDYLYGPGSGAASASAALDRQYSLPPRSASVQPTSGSNRRQRSSSYAMRPEIPDFSSMPPPAPPNRRSNSRVPPSKRLHSATNSYDGRYDGSVPTYDPSYELPYEPTYEDYGQPPPSISRRLSRGQASGPVYLPDITRATSVPPADNYINTLERARRISSMTPQPLAIQQRERARRGSNSSSGLSSNRRTHEREAHLNDLAEQVIVEKCPPEMALTKRSSGSIPSRAELEYPPDSYDNSYSGYEDYGNHEYGPYDSAYDTSGMDHGHYEGELVLRGDFDSESHALRYSSGVPPLPYGGDTYQRPIRMNSERRKSVHRRATDFPQTREPYLYGPELDQLRTGAESRGSGSERRSRRHNEYDQEGYS